MTLIRPYTDLRNNYNEISKICHQTNKPYNDLDVLSNKSYEDLTNNFEETTEERVNRLISSKFDKQYTNFEE